METALYTVSFSWISDHFIFSVFSEKSDFSETHRESCIPFIPDGEELMHHKMWEKEFPFLLSKKNYLLLIFVKYFVFWLQSTLSSIPVLKTKRNLRQFMVYYFSLLFNISVKWLPSLVWTSWRWDELIQKVENNVSWDSMFHFWTDYFPVHFSLSR